MIKKSKTLQPPDGKLFTLIFNPCVYRRIFGLAVLYISLSDDSWLQISPQELEAMMKKAAGYLPPDIGPPPSSSQSSTQQSEGAAASEFKEEGSTGSEELDLQSMVYGMKSFVDKISSHEGAEFPWYEREQKFCACEITYCSGCCIALLIMDCMESKPVLLIACTEFLSFSHFLWGGLTSSVWLEVIP